MVISLSVFAGGAGDNEVEELKVRAEGVSWFREADKEINK